jgi:hypothetical protein
MVLARAWRRRLYGGVVAAAFVPAALVAALLALAVSGGFGQLGALAQTLSGPPAPAAPPPAVNHQVSPRVLAALSAPASMRIASAGAAAQTGSVARTAVGTVPAGGSPGVAHHRSASHPVAPPPLRHHPAPGRTPHPTVIDGIVSAGTSATTQVPGPAGSAATQTLQSVGSTLDKILPPPHSLTKP